MSFMGVVVKIIVLFFLAAPGAVGLIILIKKDLKIIPRRIIGAALCLLGLIGGVRLIQMANNPPVSINTFLAIYFSPIVLVTLIGGLLLLLLKKLKKGVRIALGICLVVIPFLFSFFSFFPL